VKLIKEKNKAGFIALAVIGLLLVSNYIIPSVYGFTRDVILILAIVGALLLLWKLLAQVETLSQELTRINKTLVEKSSIKQPVCKSCGKYLSTEVNFCPDCGADQHSE
jgi:predicted Zn-ribbon and HTH transcriptional regulator